MSGRIRTVKPEWLEDERMAMASPEARVLSVALMLLADDYGRGRAARMMLLGRVFPGKAPEVLAKALEELAPWFVRLYEVDGQSYFEIRNWTKHQKVDKPGNPRVPAPSVTPENIREEEENPRASRGSRSLPDPDPDPESGAPVTPTGTPGTARPKPRDRMAEGLAGKAPKNRPDVQALFADFCELYGFTGAVLGLGAYNHDPETLAECIDARGLDVCRLVLKHSPNDGMVSGRDDESKKKHETIKYIFGNQDAFNRILRAARAAEASSPGSVADQMRKAAEARP